jgi:anti-anti-sigma factor
MALEVLLKATAQAAELILSGELDASTAPLLQAELEKAANQKPRSLVLRLRNLEYMACAGARTLLFVKQRMARDVVMYVISPQAQVLDTLRRTGLCHNVIVQEEERQPDHPLAAEVSKEACR